MSSSTCWTDNWFERTVPDLLESTSSIDHGEDSAGVTVSSSPVTRLRRDRSLKNLLWNGIPDGRISSWKDLVMTLTSPPSAHQQHLPGPVYYYCDAHHGAGMRKNGREQDCCVLGANPPDHCCYHLDLVVVTTSTRTLSSSNQQQGGVEEDQQHAPVATTTSTTTLPMAGAVDAESIAETLSLLLQWLAANNSNDNNSHYDVTLKAFATQPRQPLPRMSSSGSSITSHSSSRIRDLRLHFVAVAPDTFTSEFWKMIGPTHVELRQSTVQDWPGLFAQLEQIITPGLALTVSCTLPEFGQWAPCTLPRNVQHLKLQLHFWLSNDDPVWMSFCETLHGRAPNLQSLMLQYLEITDAAWDQLLTALQSHSSLQSLTCRYTDNFVDGHRRLTPERRTARTRAVLALVQVTPRLRHVEWPTFQQDETVLLEIDAAFMAAAQNQANRPTDDDDDNHSRSS